MSTKPLIALAPAPYLAAEMANEPPLTSELNIPELLKLNISKMHQHQATCQWIRTWSFALIGAFIGYAYGPRRSNGLLISASIIMELILFCILLKDVAWHSPFWKYRDRARLCEGFLIGNVLKEEFRSRYLRIDAPTRKRLIHDAFSPRKLIVIDTDFIEVYLMLVLPIAFLLHWLIVRWYM